MNQTTTALLAASALIVEEIEWWEKFELPRDPSDTWLAKYQIALTQIDEALHEHKGTK